MRISKLIASLLAWAALVAAATLAGETDQARMDHLNNAGMSAYEAQDMLEALRHWSTGLALATELDDKPQISKFLVNIGTAQLQQQRFDEALDTFLEALIIDDALGDARAIADDCLNIGTALRRLERYEEAISYTTRALRIDIELAIPQRVAEDLRNLGHDHANLHRYTEALGHYEAALEIDNELGDAEAIVEDVTAIAELHHLQQSYDEALPLYAELAAFHRQSGNLATAAGFHQRMGNILRQQSRFGEAIRQHEQSLAIHEKLEDPAGIAGDLGNIGNAYADSGRYRDALDFMQRAKELRQQTDDLAGVARDLMNMGIVLKNLARPDAALRGYQEALDIFVELENREGQAHALSNLGVLYSELGYDSLALQHFQDALPIYRDLEDIGGIGSTLLNAGVVHKRARQFDIALELLGDALEIARLRSDLQAQSTILNNLGGIYVQAGDWERALQVQEEALAIAVEIRDPVSQAVNLIALGTTYGHEGSLSDAFGHYARALPILSRTATPDWEWQAYQGLSAISADLGSTSAAVLFGKLAVNTVQPMRSDVRGMQSDLQKSFLQERQQPYRYLAELLIEEDRLAEAVQILTMLKEDEYFEFVLRDSTRDARTTRSVLSTAEQEFATEMEALIGETTLAGEAYVSKLNQIVADIESYGAMHAQSFDASDQAALDLPAKLIAEIGHGAILIHFLVASDAVYIVLTHGTGQIVRSSEVARVDLDKMVGDLLQFLRTPSHDPRPAARVLYQQLLGPIEDELVLLDAKTLMVSADGRLRYLPYASLYDGKRYLVEKYSTALHTVGTGTMLRVGGSDVEWRVAGFGVSEKVDGSFAALPAAADELDNIVKESTDDAAGLLSGLVRINEEFTGETFRNILRERYDVVHIASHFSLEPGSEQDSFLLLGDGQRLTLSDLRAGGFRFENVSLLTLSACHTAVGGEDAFGREIEGLGAFGQSNGAQSVLASLWAVADSSTGKLMQNFYELKNVTSVTKAEALRGAQLTLLRNKDVDDTIADLRIRGVEPALSGTGRFRPTLDAPFSHPYYWAPFVLLGNWL